MKLFIISFILIGLSLIGMAVGIMMKRGCLKGTCGGLNNFSGDKSDCPVCGKTAESKSD